MKTELKQNASLELRSPSTDTQSALNQGLFEACSNASPSQVINLIKMGADVHSCNDRALKLAALFGSIDTVTALIDNGATLSSPSCSSSDLWDTVDHRSRMMALSVNGYLHQG